MVIFDCNGVLVDGEPISAAVAAEELTRAGVPITPQLFARFFTGRRASDMIADIEAATGRRLPDDFLATLSAATLTRLNAELRPTPHAAHALTWLRGPKCVASATSLERIRLSLEIAGLARFFEGNLFSATDVRRGKPEPDLFLHAAFEMGIAPHDCIVVEDSAVGVTAAAAAGMTAIGFVGGGSHAHSPAQLTAAGARTVIADLRALKSTVVALRGW
ncbi:MAG TPA: HAD-IA family hydrolase [Xanthobacteraceae bacterium]|nr:HAD-IA family hydrolase [Xanthobacteraceae bacterium]